jgi:hypothetical protein
MIEARDWARRTSAMRVGTLCSRVKMEFVEGGGQGADIAKRPCVATALGALAVKAVEN